MGCDIHMVLEQKIGGEWVGTHSYTNMETEALQIGFGEEINNPSGWCAWKITSRNYRLFAELAGVRGDGTLGNQPRGLPQDMSQLTRVMAHDWGTDGHSHSHLSLIEFVHAWCAATDQIGTLMEHKLNPDKESLSWFYKTVQLITGTIIYEDYDNFRICFWFDN